MSEWTIGQWALVIALGGLADLVVGIALFLALSYFYVPFVVWWTELGNKRSRGPTDD